MSEKAPQSTPEVSQSGYDPSLNESYKDYLLNGGEMGQKLRSKASAEADPAVEGSSTVNYRDDLMNRVGNHRTDGPLLDESERARSFLENEASNKADEPIAESIDDNSAEAISRDFEEGDVIKLKGKGGEVKDFRVKRITTTNDKYRDKVALLESVDGSEEMVGLYSGIQKGIVADAEKSSEDSKDSDSAKKSEESDASATSSEEELPLNLENLVEELVQTTDAEEARNYWEMNIKDTGVTLEAFMAQGVEGSWLVKRLVEKKPEEPVAPAPEAPVEEEPADEASEDDNKTKVVPVVDTPDGGDKAPVKPEKRRKKSRIRKFGRACLAALALLPGAGYVAGRVHENYIIKSHDTPAIDEINKNIGDNTNNLPAEMQEDMAKNYAQTEAFFESVATAEGSENFKNFEKVYADTVAKFTEKYGDTLSKDRIEELAEKEVKAKLAALDLSEAEKAANK